MDATKYFKLLHPNNYMEVNNMGTSQPIRSLDELTAFRSYYLNKEVNLRNYMLICMGLNTALRISDMLQLKWGNVYDFDRKHYVKHIVVCEGKTGKETRIAINNNLIEAFEMYMGSLKSVSGNDYIFTGKTSLHGGLLGLQPLQLFCQLFHGQIVIRADPTHSNRADFIKQL